MGDTSRKLLKLGERTVLPITDFDAVLDGNGNTLTNTLTQLDTDIRRDFQAADTALSDQITANFSGEREIVSNSNSVLRIDLTSLQTEVSNSNARLDSRIKALEDLIDETPGSIDTTIDKFNEIVAFLENIQDTQTLEGIINGINQSILNEANERERMDAGINNASMTRDQNLLKLTDLLFAKPTLTASITGTSCVYKGVDQTVTMKAEFSSDMNIDPDKNPSKITISGVNKQGETETEAATGSRTVTKSIIINHTNVDSEHPALNTQTFTAEAWMWFQDPEDEEVLMRSTYALNFRYPIYYGFGDLKTGSSYDSDKISAFVTSTETTNATTAIYAPTTSATRSYPARTTSANNQHYYLLVPEDVTTATLNFSVGGAPMAVTSSTQIINNQSYKIYESDAVYPNSTSLIVTVY